MILHFRANIVAKDLESMKEMINEMCIELNRGNFNVKGKVEDTDEKVSVVQFQLKELPFDKVSKRYLNIDVCEYLFAKKEN